MTTAVDPATEDPAVLREQMIRTITDRGHLRLSRVRDALRTVPRHLFVPDVPLRDAYNPDLAITTKPNPDGRLPRSCASVPTVVATMLDQLDPHPGAHILEIGAGTGYNAALLAQLVGEQGHVVTIDIDPDVTAQARHALDSFGYSRVDVITADGTDGHPTRAPYDGIIVTVGPWDLPPAWTRQLTDGGRMIVPLRFRGNARGIQFTRDGDLLRSTSSRLMGFIPMLGPNQNGEREGTIDPAGTLTLTWDTDQDIAPAHLASALTQPTSTEWSGAVIIPGQSFDSLWLRLAATEPGTCRLAASTTEGIAPLAVSGRNPAVVDADSFTYLTLRELAPTAEGTRRFELGAAAYGPARTTLAARFAQQIRAWDTDRDAQPTITAYPPGTPTENIPRGQIIDKPSNRLLISY